MKPPCPTLFKYNAILATCADAFEKKGKCCRCRPVVPTTQHPARRLLKRVGQVLSLLCRLMPTQSQFHISNTAQFRSRTDIAEREARLHYPDSQYSWAQWTGDISNMFDKMNHEAILEAVGWALNNVAGWSSSRMRRVARFSVAMYGKGAQLGCDYTVGEMVTITATQVMQVCRYVLAHSYVNVRHKLYKRGLGAPIGGLLSAYYAILCCSRREATAFTPMLPYVYLVLSVGIWMNRVYVAIAYANENHLTRPTKVVHFVAAEGTGYPPTLVLNLEPEGSQRFLELYIECVGTAILVSFYNKVAGDWIKTRSTVQVRLPSASSSVSGVIQQSRVRGTIRRMLECGVKLFEMVRAITELQYECALSGYRQSHTSSALRHFIARPSYARETKVMIMEVWESETQWLMNLPPLGYCLISLSILRPYIFMHIWLRNYRPRLPTEDRHEA